MTTKDNLYGLVLSGGKSTRMGRDKGQLLYHGMPHRDYLYHLLNKFCERSFLSIRKSQQTEINQNQEFIVDTDEFKGPLNGILSAHQLFPEASWLVLACDLPFMDQKAVSQLIENRDKEKVASVFATTKSKLPEPLCALWEPEGLKKVKKWLETSETSCPRKFLINSDTKLVFPENDKVLFNANSKLDYQEALSKI
ncbi:molybdenum cofactor guanylyltransferase [Ascidiimonas sp. W6]|uniref:molybdenum cofactor guanylyltransferase n=1 Tax=Ascidiimonas meishanensis TaxID=3128903 RepID=UPI0030EBA828